MKIGISKKDWKKLNYKTKNPLYHTVERRIYSGSESWGVITAKDLFDFMVKYRDEERVLNTLWNLFKEIETERGSI